MSSLILFNQETTIISSSINCRKLNRHFPALPENLTSSLKSFSGLWSKSYFCNLSLGSSDTNHSIRNEQKGKSGLE